LETKDRDPWMDWQDISPTSEWLEGTYTSIEVVDTLSICY
jgi:hypothetical protein